MQAGTLQTLEELSRGLSGTVGVGPLPPRKML